MDGNLYAVEKMAAQRLLELRAARAHAALLASTRTERVGVAAVVGGVLIRAGEWLARGGPSPRSNGEVRVAPLR